MTAFSRTAGFALLVAALLAPGASSALAKPKTPVSCGQVLTHSIHLKNDLTDCPGPGLVIGADHIRVDLGGHVVDGVNNPTANGIDNTGGFDDVTVTHGSIQQFGQGVDLVNASGNRLVHLKISQASGRGIELAASDHTKVSYDTVTATFDGIHLDASTQNRISHDKVFGNTASAIVLITGSNGNTVDHNTTHDDASWGITSDNSVSNTYDHNRVYKNGIAGIEPFHGVNMKITHNTVFSNHIGIELFTTTGSVLRANKVRGSDLDGIHTFVGSTGNLLQNNSTRSNGADGIDVTDAGNTLKRNHANRNTGLGIFAAPGNTDGGGNTAHHNGGVQCAGVTCH
jgi:parallel beta-helix repeat protein